MIARHLCFEMPEISVPDMLPESPKRTRIVPKAQGEVCSEAQSSRKRQTGSKTVITTVAKNRERELATRAAPPT